MGLRWRRATTRTTGSHARGHTARGTCQGMWHYDKPQLLLSGGGVTVAQVPGGCCEDCGAKLLQCLCSVCSTRGGDYTRGVTLGLAC